MYQYLPVQAFGAYKIREILKLLLLQLLLMIIIRSQRSFRGYLVVGIAGAGTSL